MRPRRLLFAEHTREELQELAPATLVVLPLGATEQHGPHLPVGTDSLTIDHLARESCEQAAAEIPLLLTSTLAFGNSEYHLPFGGTLSISTEVYYRVLCDLIRSLALDGFQRIFLMNGHGGNQELAQLAARDMAVAHPVRIAVGPYWTIAWDALVALGAHKGCRFPGHAGRFETSVMLALRGDLVAENRPKREPWPDTDPIKGAYGAFRTESHGSWQKIDGYGDSPADASASSGEQYLPVMIEGLAQAMIRFYRSTLSS
jgi:creatinine amidohydrolase